MAAKKQLSVETFRAHAAEDVLKRALEELNWKNVRTPMDSRVLAYYLPFTLCRLRHLPALRRRSVIYTGGE